jgi:4-hydroxy-4-methyl-2-oxoglutarate aldolase
MTVIRHPDAAPVLTAADWARLARIPPAVALDRMPGAWLATGIRPLMPAGRQPRLCARAVTAQPTPPDFGAVVQALDLCGPGDVLVIAAGGDPHTAMIGEILSGHLRARGAAGVVIDGAVRDVGTLAAWPDFSVFAAHVTPRGPTGAAHGAVGGPVPFAGGTIHAGDVILGDDDGLVILPAAAALAGLPLAEAKLAQESTWTEGLAAGHGAAAVFALPPMEPAGAS